MASTRWVKLDVQYMTNRKTGELTDTGKALHIGLLTYCAAELTDGHVSPRAMRLVTGLCTGSDSTVTRSRRQLEALGLIHPTENGEPPGWYVHDFLAMNPQLRREIVEQERRTHRARQARYMARIRGEGDGVSDGLRDETRREG